MIREGSENISRGGIYINTHNLPAVGSNMALEFHIPKQKRNIKCEGVVVWGYLCDPLRDGRDIPGMGIKLTEMKQGDIDLISEFAGSEQQIYRKAEIIHWVAEG